MNAEKTPKMQSSGTSDPLESLRSIRSLSTDPFFMTRLEARLENSEPKGIFGFQLSFRPALSFATFGLLFALNVFSIATIIGSDSQASKPSLNSNQNDFSSELVTDLVWDATDFAAFSDLSDLQ